VWPELVTGTKHPRGAFLLGVNNRPNAVNTSKGLFTVSIKKPSAVDSPYVTTDTTPTRLASTPVAGGGVNTVAATVAKTVSANANANTSSTSTGSNVSYYTAGIEGVNQLATYGRVFAGANVYVTLEQPQYITYNQNYTGSGTVGGANGQIQFNNNGLFAGSANLTFDGANIAVGGIKTNNYYYANGTPFVSGNYGNANVVANLAALGSNPISTTGNITGGNIRYGSGIVSGTGNIFGNRVVATQGTFKGDQYSDGALYVGNYAGTVLGSDVVIQITANAGGYSQTNFQNINSGNRASSDYIITADNGNDVTHYIDLGMTSSGWNGSETNVLAGLVPNNGYLYVQDGNLTLGTRNGNVSYGWNLGTDGSTIFPILTTQRGDNPSGTISGQTLLFGDATQEAIISTPDGSNADGINSQRLVINPGKGEDSNGGEGGDIYLWAGRGGNNNGSGGDVKIRGGYAPADGTGGYIRIDGGASEANGDPGFIEITGGQGGNTSGGYVQITGGVGGSGIGGSVDIIGGFGQAGPGADVSITGGGSANGLAEYGNVNIAAGASTWSFRNNGTTRFPNDTIQTANNQSLTIRTPSSGNAYSTMYQNSSHWEAYAEDDETGADSGWAWIFAELPTIDTPQVFIENKTGSDGISKRWTFDAAGNLTLPNGALVKDTTGDSVAFGQNAGANSQYQHAVAIGLNAGYQYQGEDSVAIGFDAGYYNQGRGVAIGYQAGQGTNQSIPVSATYGGSGPAHIYVSGTGNPSLVLDSVTGVVAYDQWVTGNNIPSNTYVTNIYPGEDRIEISQPPTAALAPGDAITFIGSNIGVASTSSLVAGARVLGTNIPDNTYINNILGPNNIDISQRPSAPLVDGDYLDFYIGQGGYATAIGYNAGTQYQDVNAVAVGRSAGTNHQGANTVAVGYVAGAYSQGANAVAIGAFAGTQTQGMNTVAIGYHTGGNTQGARAVAIGEDAGRETQGFDAIAIGRSAGSNGQGNSAIAMGWNAGQDNQGQQAIAIGEDAGQSSLGEYSIAIGFKAGFNSQANNSIVLNATGGYLTAPTSNTFVVKPIRNSSTGNVLYYDQTSGEITFNAGGTANTGNVTFSDQIVIGTGISNLISGLYLAPSSSSANAVQYLRVRGDVTYEPTHIHFDTGNNQYFNQFIGDDNKYVLLSNTGNIVINTDDYAGNSAQWTFGANGNLTLPGNILGSGNILIYPDSANTDGYLDIYLTTGPDVHVASNGDSNLILGRDSSANVTVNNSSGAVTIQSWSGGANVWTFGADGNLTTPGGSGDITGANLISAVAFSATGNITAGNVLVTGNIGPLSNVASPAPSINGFSNINSINVSASGNIIGNIYPQSGAVLYVDGNRTDTYTPNGTINFPYKTVQDALDDATANTTINVAPGLYSENIVMPDLDGICILGSSEMNTTIANAAPGHTFNWSPSSSVGNSINKFCLTNLEFVNTDTTGTYHTLHINAANVTYPNTFIGEEMDIQTVDFEGAQSQSNTTVYLNNVGVQLFWHSQIYGGAVTVINPGEFRSTSMVIGNTGDPHDFNVTYDGSLPRNGLGRNDITLAAGSAVFGNVNLNGHPIYQEDVDTVIVGNLNGANLSTFYASGRDYSPTILAYGQHGVVGGTGGSINLTFPDPNTSGTSFNFVDFSNGHILGKVSLTKANLLPLSARGYAVVQGQAQFDTSAANGISANGYVAMDLRGANFNQSALQATGAATIDRSVVTLTSRTATTAGNVITISPPLAAGATYTTAVTPNSNSTVWVTSKNTGNLTVTASANTTVDITVIRNT
jgi:hypothetical protein